ncbi:MAG: CPBP family intramembrane metalloprotease [Planctomycetes bacterium]|nr:CPBP family intramembrane metalloprotease [Planctomycetota bacterium]
MSAAAASARVRSRAQVPDSTLAPTRSLAVGLVAIVPLFACYEFALLAQPRSARNFGELCLGLALRPFGSHADAARAIVLLLGSLAAFLVASRRGRASLGSDVARVFLEGALAACVLGPVMVIVLRSCAPFVPVFDAAWDQGASGPGLVDTALVFGAGAWEELVFRVGLYSFVYWLALRFFAAFDVRERAARAGADVLGLALSSLLFAAAHFEPVLRHFGPGGRPFDPALFAWLTLGGVAMGLLFRLRGPGVAAWAHGLFNVALWIGLDPDVIW